uniref:Uncharacterized protein n=1 Tax=Odontella aurita TaxID=265563 RepID=A0A7S4HJG3_9STRA|mmetsp:Transcript_10963/g.32458  ORF Transcript_10963/g.32458 Transcript_10963/m.32458 type:complete len:627 (+) Transcript_10963:281-2161(+)
MADRSLDGDDRVDKSVLTMLELENIASEESSQHTENTFLSHEDSNDLSRHPAPAPHEFVYGRSVYDTPLPSDVSITSEQSDPQGPSPHELVYGRSVYDTIASDYEGWDDSSTSECSCSQVSKSSVLIYSDKDAARSQNSIGGALQQTEDETRVGRRDEIDSSSQDDRADYLVRPSLGSQPTAGVTAICCSEEIIGPDHVSRFSSTKGDVNASDRGPAKDLGVTPFTRISGESVVRRPQQGDSRMKHFRSVIPKALAQEMPPSKMDPRSRSLSKMRNKATRNFLCLYATIVLGIFVLWLATGGSSVRNHKRNDPFEINDRRNGISVAVDVSVSDTKSSKSKAKQTTPVIKNESAGNFWYRRDKETRKENTSMYRTDLSTEGKDFLPEYWRNAFDIKSSGSDKRFSMTRMVVSEDYWSSKRAGIFNMIGKANGTGSAASGQRNINRGKSEKDGQARPIEAINEAALLLGHNENSFSFNRSVEIYEVVAVSASAQLNEEARMVSETGDQSKGCSVGEILGTNGIVGRQLEESEVVDLTFLHHLFCSGTCPWSINCHPSFVPRMVKRARFEDIIGSEQMAHLISKRLAKWDLMLQEVESVGGKGGAKLMVQHATALEMGNEVNNWEQALQ